MSFAGEAFTKDTYFVEPKQIAIMIVDEDDVETFIGVAYRDEVICLCCGTVFDREELAEEGAVYKILDWYDLDYQVKEVENPFKEEEDFNS